MGASLQARGQQVWGPEAGAEVAQVSQRVPVPEGCREPALSSKATWHRVAWAGGQSGLGSLRKRKKDTERLVSVGP